MPVTHKFFREIVVNSIATALSIPESPGSVSGAPNLPEGFTESPEEPLAAPTPFLAPNRMLAAA